MKQLFVFLTMTLIAFSQDTLYVDGAASGANDGTNWVNAYDSLQVALANASNGDQIWIAKGVYKVTSSANRDTSFILPNSLSLELYGGFTSGATDISTRDLKNDSSILSGDIGVQGLSSDNTHHILRVNANSAYKRIDGLHFFDGNANGGSIITGGAFLITGAASGKIEIRNSSFTRNRADEAGAIHVNGGSAKVFILNSNFANNDADGIAGGAIKSETSDSLLISHSTFYSNFAASGGGGIHSTGTGVFYLINSLFSNNGNGDNGGGAYVSNAQTTIEQNTFYYNDAGARGGGLYYNNSSPITIRSNIFWANTSGFGAAPAQAYSNVAAALTFEATNNIVQDGLPQNTAGAVNASDPLFVDPDGLDNIQGTIDDNFRLLSGSPALNAGALSPIDRGDIDENGNNTEQNPFDLDFELRSEAGGEDIGAYEGEIIILPDTIYVDLAASGANTGSTWSDAFTDLNMALSVVNDGDQIWIAKGVYVADPASQVVSFVLPSNLNIALYGGFTSGATDITSRNLVADSTILSGDINSPGVNTDNTHNIMRLNGNNASKTLNGLHFRDANATGSASEGSAIQSMNGTRFSRLRIQDCSFTNNIGFAYGGAIFIGGGNDSTLLTIVNSLFENNSLSESSTYGGAIYYEAPDSLVISHSRFISNSTNTDGGAISTTADSTKLFVINNLFLANTSLQNGGAIAVQGTAASSGPYVFTQNTFAFNTAPSFDGGAIHFDMPIIAGLATNNIFWRNSSGNATLARRQVHLVQLNSMIFNSNIIQDGLPTNHGGGSGNSFSYPLFVDTLGLDATAGTGDENLELLIGSPAYNFGGGVFQDLADIDGDGDTSEPLPIDLNANSRVQDGTIEIGAYEGVIDPFLVTSLADDGSAGTLRGAINYANSNFPADTIRFDATIKDQTIVLSTDLPSLIDNSTVIDGSTGDLDSLPHIIIDGTNITQTVFDISADSIELRFLNIIRSANYTVQLSGGSNQSHIWGNHFGTTLDGNDTTGNRLNSKDIYLQASADFNLIGDSLGRRPNVFAGNPSDRPIYLQNATNNVIAGNIIGVSKDFSQSFSAHKGMLLSATSTNNRIGTPNSGGENVIAGLTSAAAEGIELTNTSSNNRIVNNYLGITPGGTIFPNNYGIRISSTNNVVGDTISFGRNFIATSTSANIWLVNAGDNNLIQNNFIGTNLTGNLSAGSTGSGIRIDGRHNYIGGPSAKQRNIISGNGSFGIEINDSLNIIDNNYIGVGVDGSTAVDNLNTGIFLSTIDAASNSIVGNIIANNGDAAGERGIRLENNGVQNTLISNNSIFDNFDTAISRTALAQNNIPTPSILFVAPDSTVSGTANPFASIELFADDFDEAEFFAGSTTADAAGNWSIPNVDLTLATNLTATQRDAANNTSILSLPMASMVQNPLEVTRTVDNIDSVGSLRFALNYANNNAGADTITFLVNNDTIFVDTVLTLSGIDPIIIDGQSQNMVLKATALFPAGDRAMFSFQSDFNIIRNLELDGGGNARHGIFFDNPGQGDDNKADNMYIHHFENGVVGDAHRDTLINSTISQNSNAGVSLGLFAFVGNNYVGTDASGTTGLYGQKIGLGVDAYSDIVNNVISGNDSLGVLISGSNVNFFQNKVGVNAGGNAAIANNYGGVLVQIGANHTDIGDALPSNRNIISGHNLNNGFGVRIDSDSNLVAHNYFGLGSDGLTPIPNYDGLNLNDANDNDITNNVASSNTNFGMSLFSSSFNTYSYNLIGTSSDTITARGNGTNGLYTTFGDNNDFDHNIFAYNANHGLVVATGDSLESFIEANRFYGNLSTPIDIEINAQQNIVPATWSGLIDEGNTVNGATNLAGSQLLLAFYVDSAFVDTIRTDFAGNFSRTFTAPELAIGDSIRVLFNDVNNNTSNFSAAISTQYIDPLIVTNTSDDIATIGSFRYALNYANSTAAADTIVFGISSVTIPIDTSLVFSGDSTVVDAWTDNVTLQANSSFPGFLIELEGGINNRIYGLNLDGNSLVDYGLKLSQSYNFVDSISVQNFNQWGIIATGNQDTIYNSHISNNLQGGVFIAQSSDSIQIEKSRIGTSPDGNSDGGTQQFGIVAQSPSWILDNVISGNDSVGIRLDSGNHVYGNLIGLNSTGNAAVANSVYGIWIDGASNNDIGKPGSRNVISGNGEAGIYLSFSDSNYIRNNYIGTDSASTTAIANGNSTIGAITLNNSNFNIIGDSGAGNIISGNNAIGIYLSANSRENRVENNIVGALRDSISNPTGQSHGIYIHNSARGNHIGGILAGTSNIIGHHTSTGIFIQNAGSDSNQVYRNYIGTNHSLANLGNNIGIRVQSATGNRIGDLGDFSLANRILHNTAAAVELDGTNDNRFGANFFRNNGSTLNLINSANNGIQNPQINFIGLDSVITGSSSPNSVVSLYADDFSQGEFYLDTVRADGLGDWSYDLSGMLNLATNIVAIQDSLSNTSGVAVTASVVTNPLLVTNAVDDGLLGSISYAVNYANSNPGPDTVFFDAALSGSTISLASQLLITDPAFAIDGEAGQSDNLPHIMLRGDGAINGLRIQGSRSLVKNLAFSRFNRAIELEADSIIVEGNFFGLALNGLDTLNQALHTAVFNTGTSFNLIGDTLGVFGNVFGQTNTSINISSTSSNILVSSNSFGVAPDGISEISQSRIHIGIYSSQDVVVERNIITGQSSAFANGAIEVNSSTRVMIDDNLIGVKPDNTAYGNKNGIIVSNGSTEITIGDSIQGQLGNVISGNTDYGIWFLSAGTRENSVFQNYIGTDTTGLVAMPNLHGIVINSGVKKTEIGGLDRANVISGNSNKGILISGADSVLIAQNAIGLGSDLQTAVPNVNGIDVSNATNIFVGLDSLGNLISGNSNFGVWLNGTSHGTLIEGNIIGSDTTATLNLGNGTGIRMDSGASQNEVLNNKVLFNTIPILFTGITTDSNTIHGNNIFNNTNRLSYDGFAQGDIQAPRITGVLPDSSVIGTANPNGLIQLFADFGNQGEFYLDTVRADGSGFWTLPNVDLNLADSLTAMVDSASNTSNFSLPFASEVQDPLEVTSLSNDSNLVGSFAYAINYANSNMGADTIYFHSSLQDAVFTPNKNFVLTDDGTVIDGDINSDNIPDIVFNGLATQAFAFDLTADNSTIHHLKIVNYTGAAIRILSGQGNEVSDNFIGTINGTLAVPNVVGVQVVSANGNNHIVDNLISGNSGAGITLANGSSNVILGNMIGVDSTGNAALANNIGIQINSNSDNNLIGDSVTIANRNIISGNTQNGIDISFSAGNEIYNNFIGLGKDGNTLVGNGQNGVFLGRNSNATQIGNGNPSNRNVISGNTQDGIHLYDVILGSLSENHIIQGNFIGTDSTGTLARGNGSDGIELNAFFGGASTRYNTIGGNAANEFNVISANAAYGIRLFGESTHDNTILTNYIGTDSLGNLNLANGSGGVLLSGGAHDNTFVNNRVVNHSSAGIYVDNFDQGGGTISYNNLFHGNEVYNNSTAYSFDSGVQNGVGVPTILALQADSTVSGTATNANVLIQLYTDSLTKGQARSFIDTVRADGVGNWSYKLTTVQANTELTAMQDDAGNTSALSSAFALSFQPILSGNASINYGSIAYNTSSSDTVSITNTGNADLTISAITFDIGTEFILNDTIGLVPIPAGSTTKFAIDFAPNSAAIFSDSLRFFTNDPNANPFVVGLDGTGLNIAPTIDAALGAVVVAEDTVEAFIADLSANYSDANSDALVFTASVYNGTSQVNSLVRGDSLFVTAVQDSLGNANLELSIFDGAATVFDTLAISIDPRNDFPISSGEQNSFLSEDTGLVSIVDVNNIFSDVDGDAMTFSITNAPSLYTASFLGNILQLTTHADVFGVDTIGVTADDGNGGTLEENWIVTITPRNDLPVLFTPLVNQAINEDTVSAFIADLPTNFSDIDGDLLSYSTSILNLPQGTNITNSVYVQGDSLFVTASPDSNGLVQIEVTADDGNGGSVRDTVDVTINPVNDAPTTLGSPSFTSTEDAGSVTAFSNLSSFFNDVDGDLLNLSIQSAHTKFTALILGNTLQLTTVADSSGTDSVVIRATDPSLAYVDHKFEVVLTAVNDAPSLDIAINDTIVPEDTTVAFVVDPSAHFSDVDNSLTYTLFTISGSDQIPSFSVRSDSIFVNTAPDSTASATFEIVATDGILTARDTFVVSIDPRNDAPTTLGAPSFTSTEDAGSVTAFSNLSSFFNDVDGDLLNLSIQSAHTKFTALILGNTLQLTTVADSNGTDSVVIRATDPSLAYVDHKFEVVLTAVNDAPSLDIAISDATIPEDTTVAFVVDPSAHFSDADGDPLTFTLFTLSGATHIPSYSVRSDSIFLNTAMDSLGPASFEIVADDGILTVRDTFTVFIDPRNDAPNLVSALPDLTMSEDTLNFQFDFSPYFSDVDTSNTLTGSYNFLSGASLFNSVTVAADGVVSFNPEADSVGLAVMEVIVSDGFLDVRDTINVTITNKNDAPEVVSIVSDMMVSEDTSPLLLSNFTSFYRDIDGDALSITTNVIQGTNVVTSEFRADSIIITAFPDSNGIALVEFVIDDSNGGILRDTMQYTVNPVNDAPQFMGIDSYTMAEDTGRVFIGLLSDFFDDVDYDVLTNSLGSVPTLYASELSGDSLFFNSIADQNGLDSLVLSSDDGTVTINHTLHFDIQARNDLPVVLATPSLVLTEDDPETFIDLVTNLFSDPDGDALSYSLDANSDDISLDLRFDSLFVTAILDSNGSTFPSIYAFDGSGDSVGIAMTIDITAVNDAPYLANNFLDSLTVTEFDENVFVGSTSSTFSDIDNATLTLSVTAIEGAGKIDFIYRNDSLLVTTKRDSFGIAKIQILAEDAGALSAADTVVIEVLEFPNTAPVFTASSLQNALYASSYNGVDSVRASDAEDNSLLYTLISGPSWLTMKSDGAIEGIPNKIGQDSLIVSVTDGYDATQDTIRLTVDAVALTDNSELSDSLMIGYNGYSFNKVLQSGHSSAVSYTLSYSSADANWVSFTDTNFTMLSSQSIDIQVHTSSFARTRTSASARVYIENTLTSIKVDSFDLNFDFDLLANNITSSFDENAVQQNVISGDLITEKIRLFNRSDVLADSINIYLTDNSGWISVDKPLLHIASQTSDSVSLSFDFSAMTEVVRQGSIYVVDREFASDTIASYLYTFTKQLNGQARFVVALKDSFNTKTLNKSGFSMEWELQNAGADATSQLQLFKDGASVFEERSYKNFSYDLANLENGNYEFIVLTQDTLIDSFTGLGDTLSFTIEGDVMHLNKGGFWSLISPVSASGKAVSGLLPGKSLSYYSWNSDTEEYEKVNAETVNPMKAYWVKLADGESGEVTIDYNVSKFVAADTVSGSLTVKAGWNLIGSPWNHDIYLQGLEVNIAGTFVPYTTAALSDTSIDLVEYVFDETDTIAGYQYNWVSTDDFILKAKNGYWFRSDAEREIRYKSIQRYQAGTASKKSIQAWSGLLTFKTEKVTDELKFTTSDAMSKEKFVSKPPQLNLRQFEAAIDDKYGHVRIPNSKLKENQRYEITLRGKVSEMVQLSSQSFSLNGEERYIYIQQLSTGKVIALHQSSDSERQLRLMKKEEKALVYISKDANFEVPFMPTKFDLRQNYPNPFNPVTNIVFDLPYTKEKFKVRVEIFNILGQKIKTLVNTHLEAGRQTLQWKGLNDRGRRVASGMYFYSVQAGSFFKTKKMVLIK